MKASRRNSCRALPSRGSSRRASKKYWRWCATALPFAADPHGPVVLAGGSSQLAGLPEVAARILGRQVRIGRPLGIAGLPDIAKGPAFAAAAGLLVYPQLAYLEHYEPRRTRHLMTGTDG